MKTLEDAIPRFKQYRVKFGPDDCWPWIKAKTKAGYGLFGFQGRAVTAHRFAYMMSKGDIPDGLVVDHMCETRDCTNPRHLQAITQRENLAKGPNKPKDACVNGHRYEEKNTYKDPKNGYRQCRICRRAAGRRRRT